MLPDGHLIRTTSFVTQEEADIEDLLGRPMFRFLVNGCLGIAGTAYDFPEIKPAESPERLVKEVEDFNKALPPAISEFGHNKPVEYLLGITDSTTIPGIEDALTKFEQLFKELNALLTAG